MRSGCRDGRQRARTATLIRTPGTFDPAADDEQLAVRAAVDPATGYTDTGCTWLSGPTKGYGSGIGGRPNPALEERRMPK